MLSIDLIRDRGVGRQGIGGDTVNCVPGRHGCAAGNHEHESSEKPEELKAWTCHGNHLRWVGRQLGYPWCRLAREKFACKDILSTHCGGGWIVPEQEFMPPAGLRA